MSVQNQLLVNKLQKFISTQQKYYEYRADNVRLHYKNKPRSKNNKVIIFDSSNEYPLVVPMIPIQSMLNTLNSNLFSLYEHSITPGLGNFTNTCFINSAIQFFGLFVELRKFLLNKKTQKQYEKALNGHISIDTKSAEYIQFTNDKANGKDIKLSDFGLAYFINYDNDQSGYKSVYENADYIRFQGIVELMNALDNNDSTKFTVNLIDKIFPRNNSTLPNYADFEKDKQNDTNSVIAFILKHISFSNIYYPHVVFPKNDPRGFMLTRFSYNTTRKVGYYDYSSSSFNYYDMLQINFSDDKSKLTKSIQELIDSENSVEIIYPVISDGMLEYHGVLETLFSTGAFKYDSVTKELTITSGIFFLNGCFEPGNFTEITGIINNTSPLPKFTVEKLADLEFSTNWPYIITDDDRRKIREKKPLESNNKQRESDRVNILHPCIMTKKYIFNNYIIIYLNVGDATYDTDKNGAVILDSNGFPTMIYDILKYQGDYITNITNNGNDFELIGVIDANNITQLQKKNIGGSAGHWVSYVKYNEWYLCNDSSISALYSDLKTTIQQPYLLLYRRILYTTDESGNKVRLEQPFDVIDDHEILEDIDEYLTHPDHRRKTE